MQKYLGRADVSKVLTCAFIFSETLHQSGLSQVKRYLPSSLSAAVQTNPSPLPDSL